MPGLKDFINNDLRSSVVNSMLNNGYSSSDVSDTFNLASQLSASESSSDIENLWDHILHGNSNDIAKQNMYMQAENTRYQRALQERIFQREDSAYQRMVSDVRNAGLSPLGLNGSQAGAPVGSEAPQNHSQQMGALSAITNILSTVTNFKSAIAEIQNKQAQTNFINSQAKKVDNENSLFDFDIEKGLRKFAFESGKQDYYAKIFNNLNLNRDYEFLNAMGWSSNTPDWLKSISLGANLKLLDSEKGHFSNAKLGEFSTPRINLNDSVLDYDKVLGGLTDNLFSLGSALFKGDDSVLGKITNQFIGLLQGFLPNLDVSYESLLPFLMNYMKPKTEVNHGSGWIRIR